MQRHHILSTSIDPATGHYGESMKRYATFALVLIFGLALSACGSSRSDEDPGTTMDQRGAETDIAAAPRGAGTPGGVESFETVRLPVAPGSQEQLNQTVGDTVLFGFDQSELSAEARAILDRQASWLQRYGNLRIVIEGHADERGTREYNLALGARRAASARNYLIAQGVDPERISVISYGKERPAAGGSDERSWRLNRRAVTVIE